MPFASLQGHLRPRQILLNAWRNERLAHAYLFCGPAGIGKERMAIALFQRLHCAAAGEDACGQCSACRRIEHDAATFREKVSSEAADDVAITGSYPDLQILRPIGPVIRIEQVRELTRRLPYPPVSGLWRCVLLREAHCLNPAAANALLKTLEEPTQRTLIVLVTHAPHLLLSTIRSRCQQIPFAALSTAEVRAILAARSDLSAEQCDVLAALSGGCPGQAFEWLNNPAVADRADWLRRFLALPGSAVEPILRFAESLANQQSREALPLYLHLLRLWLRDLMLLVVGGTGDDVANRDLLEELRRAAAVADRDHLLASVSAVERAELALRGNANVALTLDWLFLHLCRGRLVAARTAC